MVHSHPPTCTCIKSRTAAPQLLVYSCQRFQLLRKAEKKALKQSLCRLKVLSLSVSASAPGAADNLLNEISVSAVQQGLNGAKGNSRGWREMKILCKSLSWVDLRATEYEGKLTLLIKHPQYVYESVGERSHYNADSDTEPQCQSSWCFLTHDLADLLSQASDN